MSMIESAQVIKRNLRHWIIQIKHHNHMICVDIILNVKILKGYDDKGQKGFEVEGLELGDFKVYDLSLEKQEERNHVNLKDKNDLVQKRNLNKGKKMS